MFDETDELLKKLRGEAGKADADRIFKSVNKDGTSGRSPDVYKEHYTDYTKTRADYTSRLARDEDKNVKEDGYYYTTSTGPSGTVKTVHHIESFADELGVNSDDALAMINAANIFSSEQIHSDRFNKFARYGIMDMYNEHTTSREYLFFSKPDLHIFETSNPTELYSAIADVPFFQTALSQYPESLYSLQQTFDTYKKSLLPNGFNSRNLFMPILTNQVTSSLDLPSISATETTNNANLYQFNTSYRDGSEISDCSHEFTLEFADTRYLDVYVLFKAYDEYFRQKYRKMIIPTRLDYIENHINADQFSIWKIIVDDTNTVIYWAKATGVFPMSVPRDAMSNFEGGIKLTVSFKAQFVRDMDPISLMELNHLSITSCGLSEKSASKMGLEMLSTYDAAGMSANTTWGSYPYIIKKGKRHNATDKEGELFKLVWLK